MKPVLAVKMRGSGMFCELNALLACAAYADEQGMDLWPHWKGGKYSPKGVDAFPLFFRRDEVPGWDQREVTWVHDRKFPNHRYAGPRGKRLPKHYVRQYGCPTPLMPPIHRKHVSGLIQKHVQPVDRVLDVMRPWEEEMRQYPTVVGLHIRGPQRLHGGAIYFSDLLGKGHPPYKGYLEKLQGVATEGAAVLLCTDAGCVVEAVRELCPLPLIVPSRHTPDKGEPHVHSKRNEKVQIGVDALKDAFLLARCDALVHGNSNLSNFVQCVNPDLPTRDVYEDLYDRVR